MVKKIVFFMLMALLLVSSATATRVYQETFNASGKSGTFTDEANMYDGNQGTFGVGDGTPSIFYMNYTIPSNKVDGTIWQVNSQGAIYNLSLLKCENNPIQLRVLSEGTTYTQWECLTPSGTWLNLSRTPSISRVYEEGVWWNTGLASAIIYSEDNPLNTLAGSIEGVLEIYNATTLTAISNTTISGGNNVTFDAVDLTGKYYNLYIKQSTPDGFTHRYYILNQTANAQNVQLYNYNYTDAISDLKVTIRDYTTNQPLSNIHTKMQRFYAGENVWRTVQHDLSDDFGVALFHIKEQSTDYRLLFYQDTRLVQQTNSMKLLCTNSVCELTYRLDLTGGTTSYNISSNFTYTNATKLLRYYWQDMQGASHTVKFNMTKTDGITTTYVCNALWTGAAGNISCNLTGSYGTHIAQVFVDGVFRESYVLNLPKAKLGDYVDRKEAGMWSLILLILFAGIGIVSPVIGVIMLVVFLLANVWLGLFAPLTSTVFVLITLFGVYIGFKVRS